MVSQMVDNLIYLTTLTPDSLSRSTKHAKTMCHLAMGIPSDPWIWSCLILDNIRFCKIGGQYFEPTTFHVGSQLLTQCVLGLHLLRHLYWRAWSWAFHIRKPLRGHQSRRFNAVVLSKWQHMATWQIVMLWKKMWTQALCCRSTIISE